MDESYLDFYCQIKFSSVNLGRLLCRNNEANKLSEKEEKKGTILKRDLIKNIVLEH